MRCLRSRHILSNVFTVVVLAFLCLPCPVKREAKQQLGIPVSEYPKSQYYGSTTCTVSVERNIAGISFLKKLQKPVLLPVYFDSPLPAQEIVMVWKGEGASTKRPGDPTVPIFILHEQYLI